MTVHFHVQIEVEAVDKTGTFLGSMWEGKANVSVALLEAGLAKLHPLFSTDRTTEAHLLVQSEKSAKKQQLKVCLYLLLSIRMKIGNVSMEWPKVIWIASSLSNRVTAFSFLYCWTRRSFLFLAP